MILPCWMPTRYAGEEPRWREGLARFRVHRVVCWCGGRPKPKASDDRPPHPHHPAYLPSHHYHHSSHHHQPGGREALFSGTGHSIFHHFFTLPSHHYYSIYLNIHSHLPIFSTTLAHSPRTPPAQLRATPPSSPPPPPQEPSTPPVARLPPTPVQSFPFPILHSTQPHSLSPSSLACSVLYAPCRPLLSPSPFGQHTLGRRPRNPASAMSQPLPSRSLQRSLRRPSLSQNLPLSRPTASASCMS